MSASVLDVSPDDSETMAPMPVQEPESPCIENEPESPFIENAFLPSCKFFIYTEIAPRTVIDQHEPPRSSTESPAQLRIASACVSSDVRLSQGSATTIDAVTFNGDERRRVPTANRQEPSGQEAAVHSGHNSRTPLPDDRPSTARQNRKWSAQNWEWPSQK